MLAGGRTGVGVGTTPAPRTAYGQVPASIPVPPSTFAQLSGAVPRFTQNLGAESDVISSQLAGTVSPATLNALKTGAAQFGVASGVPGSGLEQNQLFGNIAGFSEAQQQKGIGNYLSTIGALGPTMTNPNLAAEIASRNAEFAAAPDPKLAAEQAFQDWLRGFQYTRSAGGYGDVGRWQGGVTIGGPSGFGTTHSNWGGLGGAPPVFSTPDAFGYNFTNPEAGTTSVLGAINPQYNYSGSSYGTSNPYYYTGENDPYAGTGDIDLG